MLAHTHQARTAQDIQVVRNGRAAERDPLGNLADVELSTGQDLDQILAHRISQGDEQVAADGEVLAEGAHLGIEGAGIDQTAQVLIGYRRNALKHVDILEHGGRPVNGLATVRVAAAASAIAQTSDQLSRETLAYFVEPHPGLDRC